MSVRKIKGKQGVSVWVDIMIGGRRIKERISPMKHPLTDTQQIEAAMRSARAREAEIKASLLRGTYESPTVSPAIEVALKDYQAYVAEQPKRRKATRSLNVYGLRNFADFLLDNPALVKRVGDIKPDVIVSFVKWLREDRQLGPSTTATVLNGTRKMIGHWLQAGYLRANPFQADIVKDARPRMRHRTRVLDDQECDQLERWLSENNEHDVKDLFVLLRHTGMRLNEGCCLTFADVDFKESTIRVRNNADFQVKTSRGLREIPIAERDAHVFEMLRQRELRIKESALRNGQANTIGPDTRFFDFWTRDGSAPRKPISTMREAVRALKIPTITVKDPNGLRYEDGVSFHTLRHGYATKMYNNAAVSLTVAASILGHSLSMAQTYSHPDNGDRRRAVEAVALARASGR